MVLKYLYYSIGCDARGKDSCLILTAGLLEKAAGTGVTTNQETYGDIKREYFGPAWADKLDRWFRSCKGREQDGCMFYLV